VCRYRQLHFFYDQLCPACAALNYTKRLQEADLHGRIAFVTGGRVKIGYQVGVPCAHVAVSSEGADAALSEGGLRWF
jgi:hypothetical protein